MRFVHAAVFLAVSGSPALAQRAPVIVVPGKPGVPVFINGVDASWAVVEGEFGLDRPGEMAPIIIAKPLVIPFQYYVPGYYPKAGRRPGYGRYEVVPSPNRPQPPPAPSYFRNWNSESAPGEVTEYPPYNVPPVIVAPQGGRGRNQKGSSN